MKMFKSSGITTIFLLSITIFITLLLGNHIYKPIEKFTCKTTIIVSRYNEDVEWTKQFDNLIIYNKGNELDDTYPDVRVLKNVGREGHTYYNYICENYDNLSDYTFFLQGNPFDHCPYIVEKINGFSETDFEHLGIEEKHYDFTLTGDKIHTDIPLLDVFEMLFGKVENKDEKMDFVSGGQFVVSKKQILKRPREFYLKIVKMLEYHVNPIEGYVIERFHKRIFT